MTKKVRNNVNTYVFWEKNEQLLRIKQQLFYSLGNLQWNNMFEIYIVYIEKFI